MCAKAREDLSAGTGLGFAYTKDDSTRERQRAMQAIQTWMQESIPDAKEEKKQDELQSRFPFFSTGQSKTSLVEMGKDLYVFDESQLSQYLNNFLKLEAKIHSDINQVFIRIEGATQVVCLHYDVEKKAWDLLKPKGTEVSLPQSDVAKKIIPKLAAGRYAGCYITFLTPEKKIPEMKAEFQKFINDQRHHFLTQRMLRKRFVPRKDENISSTLMHFAINRRYSDVIEFLLKNHIIEKAEVEKWMRMVIRKENLKLLSVLTSVGINVTEINKNGANALFYAVRSKNLDKVKQILALGVDINKVNDKGWTLVHQAAYTKQTRIIKWLVEEQGLDINQQTKAGNTAAHFILDSEKTIFALKKLVNLGADFSIRNKENISPIAKAINKKLFKSAAFMIDHVAVQRLSSADDKLIKKFKIDIDIARTIPPEETKAEREFKLPKI